MFYLYIWELYLFCEKVEKYVNSNFIMVRVWFFDGDILFVV